ncbi:MAG TPA: aminotransferase class V-fold PLP-dependent enzyme [Solirubrobacteraceae bacterium]|nr:aminotransferase class V-fold PLP-dependent enzyme [Solirubrobacteraceae bacterium]
MTTLVPPSSTTSASVRPLAQLADAVAQVPLVDGSTARFVNLDYAASAPPLASVHRAVTRTLSYYASIHRGQSYLSRVSTAAYERARDTVAERTGARADDVAIFTRNTTDALNLLAAAVPGRVVHLDIEHHANLLPWLESVADSAAVRAGATFEETFEALDRELGRAPAALLAVTGASNVTGECPPLARLAGLAHRHGARLAVDGAQLAPHRRVEIEKTGIDYLAISGHKLYAPYGGGALIGRRDWLDAAEPHLPGGGAVVNVTLEGAQWKPSPARHEGGTPNLVGAVALAASLEALAELGYDRIAAHETELYERLEQGLRALGISVLQIWPERHDLVAVASFTVPGRRADLVAAYLSAEHGIGVRGGRFCAHPLLERLGLADDGAVRVSIGLGTGSEDVDALLGALERLVSYGPGWAYATDESGELAPSPDPRPSMVDAVLAGRFAFVD